ncbi:MAG: VCBS repeat-containing protein, partial [Saprospiraceae bacterium]|nr:VCBS repeat-containing protein [Pyrinomonadaceae bacterium]
MSRRLLAYLVVPVFFVVSALSTASPALGQQCGTHFQSDYRAVDKIRRFTQTGGNFILTDWTGDGRSDFWNFRFNTTTATSDIVIYPALATGYWDWDNPIIYTTTFNSSATTNNFGCCFFYQFRDFDSDGKVDMLTQGAGNSNQKIHRNMGNGTLAPQATIVNPGDSNNVWRPIGFADFTSDGRLDWVYTLEVLATGHETIYYSPLNGDGSLGSPVMILAHTAENEINDSIRILGDYDGDGDPDIAYRNSSAQSRIRVLRNMGGGTFVLGDPLSTPTFFPYGFGDLNNDGRTDIYGNSSNNLIVFSGQSDATFTVATYPLTITSGNLLRPVDFNGDGRRDLINVDDEDYEILLSNPAGGFTSQYYPRRLSSSSAILNLHFEDFSADGKADLYAAHHDIFNTFGEEIVVVKSNVCNLKGQTRGMDFGSTLMTPD